MISLSDYSSYDGLGLAALVARKEVTAKELLDAAMAAVAKVNPKLNAVLQTLPEMAAAEIAVADSQRPVRRRAFCDQGAGAAREKSAPRFRMPARTRICS